MKPKANRTVNSARNGFFGILNKLVIMIFPFIIRTIIIYTLGTEYLGLSSLFTSILSILSLTELGFGSAMVFNLYKPISDNDENLICALLNLYRKIYRYIGLIILVIGISIIPFLENLIYGTYPQDINIYILYCIYLLNTVSSYFFFSYRKALLNAYQRADVVSNVSSIVHLLFYCIQIFVLLYTKNYYLYIIWLPIATLLDNLMVYFRSKKLYKNISCVGELDKCIKKSIFKRTGALFGHNLGAVLIASLDNIVISAFLGLTTLGIYNNYYLVIITLNGFIDILASALLYSIGDFLVNKNKEEKYKLFLNLTFINVSIVSFCTCCLLSLYQDFMYVWVGEENTIQSFLTIVLFVVYFFSWKCRITGLNFKDAAGMWGNDALKPYVGIIFNVAMDIILVQIIGINGVLISTIFVMVFIYFPWETHVLFNELFETNGKYYLLKMLLYIVVTLVITSLAYFVNSFILLDNIGGLFIKLLICICFFAIIWIAIFLKTKEFKYAINKIMMLINRRKNND